VTIKEVKMITIREFTRNVYKYLEEGVYTITKNGKPMWVVEVRPFNVLSKKDKVILSKPIDAIGKPLGPIQFPEVKRISCMLCGQVPHKTSCPRHTGAILKEDSK